VRASVSRVAWPLSTAPRRLGIFSSNNINGGIGTGGKKKERKEKDPRGRTPFALLLNGSDRRNVARTWRIGAPVSFVTALRRRGGDP